MNATRCRQILADIAHGYKASKQHSPNSQADRALFFYGYCEDLIKEIERDLLKEGVNPCDAA